MNQAPEKPEILDYASPCKAVEEKPQSTRSWGGYALLWLVVLVFSFIACVIPPLIIIPLTLAGFGISGDVKDLKKSRLLFLFKALVWIAPMTFTVFLIHENHQRNLKITTNIRVDRLRRQIEEELSNERKLDASQRRPNSMVIQSFLAKPSIPTDTWGRPFRFTCPGVHNPIFDLFSAGPDGVYGNADDIGNW